jgi:hypothetical protein
MAVSTAPTVASGGVWKTPNPMAGNSTPLFSRIDGWGWVTVLMVNRSS